MGGFNNRIFEKQIKLIYDISIEIIKLFLARPEIKIDFDYSKVYSELLSKSIRRKIKNLLNSHINKYLITPILNNIEN